MGPIQHNMYSSINQARKRGKKSQTREELFHKREVGGKEKMSKGVGAERMREIPNKRTKSSPERGEWMDGGGVRRGKGEEKEREGRGR